MTARAQDTLTMHGMLQRREKRTGNTLENTLGVLMFIASVSCIWQAVKLVIKFYMQM